jgi:hypothetical protein
MFLLLHFTWRGSEITAKQYAARPLQDPRGITVNAYELDVVCEMPIEMYIM